MWGEKQQLVRLDCVCVKQGREWSGGYPPPLGKFLRVAWFPGLPTVQVFDCLKYYAKFMALWRMLLSFSPLVHS